MFEIVPRIGRNPSSCEEAEIGRGEFLYIDDSTLHQCPTTEWKNQSYATFYLNYRIYI